MAEKWLSIVEYARVYNVSDMTVRRHIKRGKLKAVLKDGKYFIPVDDRGQEKSAGPVQSNFAPARSAAISAGIDALETDRSPHEGGIGGGSREGPGEHPLAGSGGTVAPALMKKASLPDGLCRPLQHEETSLVHTEALLHFCDQALSRLGMAEQSIEDRYRNRILALEADVRARDEEIKNYRQQVEDLQLLVKLFEESPG